MLVSTAVSALVSTDVTCVRRTFPILEEQEFRLTCTGCIRFWLVLVLVSSNVSCVSFNSINCH